MALLEMRQAVADFMLTVMQAACCCMVLLRVGVIRELIVADPAPYTAVYAFRCFTALLNG